MRLTGLNIDEEDPSLPWRFNVTLTKEQYDYANQLLNSIYGSVLVSQLTDVVEHYHAQNNLYDYAEDAEAEDNK